MKKIRAPYSYILLALVSLLALINYQSKPIWAILFLVISILGLLFLTYLDRDKFSKKK